VVQVDVFWAYGIGSAFALAASHQLAARERTDDPEDVAAPARGEWAESGWKRTWSNPYLLVAALFCAVLFAPSGAYLLWEFPSWETMHAGDRDLPAWLVTLFAVTNTTQGVLGFLVTQWLIRRGRAFTAYLQAAGAYFGMFFILVHGWDGKGYQRFFSATHQDFLNWDGDWTAWLTSDVAIALYVMGVFLLPPMFALYGAWLAEGRRIGGSAAQPRLPKQLVLPLAIAGIAFVPLGAAIATSLLIHQIGWIAGSVIAVAVLWLLALRHGSPTRRALARFAIAGDAGAEPAPHAPAEQLSATA
jgi:hypothetical protein